MALAFLLLSGSTSNSQQVYLAYRAVLGDWLSSTAQTLCLDFHVEWDTSQTNIQKCEAEF
jgi:hypothetical protein